MFEEITAESLLNRMLSKVAINIDKREGSLIYDALMPAAIELKQLYIELDVIMNETFADTATRNYLIRRAKERGLEPYPATKAIMKAVFNMDVPIGSRFNLNELNYTVIEKISDGVFRVECETAGSDTNRNFGQLIPIEYINGLRTAEITELLIAGEDEESTEEFRQRYFASFNAQAYGGNVHDYKTKVKAIAGVGGCKVYRAHEWNGGGTVKLVITDSDYNVPSSELIDKVQTLIDPVVNSGEGNGVAPIGHFVTITAANAANIDVTFQLSFADNWNWEKCKSNIEAAIDDYFYELNKFWDSNTNIIVRVAQLEARILALEGIIDVLQTTINGTNRNLVIDKDSLVVRGDVDEA